MHSFPFRLVSLIWHPFLIFSFLCLMFFFSFSTSRFRWDFSVTSWFVSSQFCVCFIFCKNISTTICWVVSGNCFILLLCLCVCLFVFLQYRLVQWHCLHNTKVCCFFFCYCVWEFSFDPFIFYCVTFDLFLCLLVCLKTAAYVLKDIHNFPHLIFS